MQNARLRAPPWHVSAARNPAPNIDEWVDGEAIDYLRDIDVFEFHAEERQEIRLDREDLTSDTDWRSRQIGAGFSAEVRTPAGSVVTALTASTTTSTTERQSQRMRVQSSGLHTVRVNRSNDSMGRYRFQIRSWDP